MNKTVTLTPAEVELIREDIESTRDYLHNDLDGTAAWVDEWSTQDIEDCIDKVNVAESILKKLG